jgi:undecaprenyl-diphosphatase
VNIIDRRPSKLLYNKTVTYFQTIILALIEGLTEFLPISSTGHLILAEKLLGITATEFTKSFTIVVLYWKRIAHSRHLWKQLAIAFIPTGILGFTLYKFVKVFLLDNVLVTVLALFAGGIALLIIDRLPKLNHGSKKNTSLSTGNLISIGLFQSLSMIPGVSRSAASITGGLFSGLSRVEAVEFSFLLAIPTMVAASGYDLLKTGFSFTGNQYLLIGIGSLFSFLSALLAVKAFTSFVGKHNFTIFAVYRILLATIIWLVLKSA